MLQVTTFYPPTTFTYRLTFFLFLHFRIPVHLLNLSEKYTRQMQKKNFLNEGHIEIKENEKLFLRGT